MQEGEKSSSLEYYRVFSLKAILKLMIHGTGETTWLLRALGAIAED